MKNQQPNSNADAGNLEHWELRITGKEKGSEPSIDTHFDWAHSLARWPDRCASSIRGQSIMCLAAGTGAGR